MANTIKIKRNTSNSDAPTTSDIAQGELGFTEATQTLFYRDASDNIRVIGGEGAFLRSNTNDTMSGNLTVTGNLTVEGTTTTVDSSTVTITDPFIKLSKDNSKTIDVVNHCINHLKKTEGYIPDLIVLLQPTSPLRPIGLIDDCINEFVKGDYSNLATGYYCKFQEFGSHNNNRRQDIKGFFYDDGSLYILTPSLIKNNQWSGDKIKRIINKKEFSFEIDDEVDFLILENLIKNHEKSL